MSLLLLESPIQELERLSQRLGIELFAKRDDLLPFPLAGNKVRKLYAEIEGLPDRPDVVITNGAVDSNHCRTTALLASERGVEAQLVLHGDASLTPRTSRSLALLDQLGATYEIVKPEGIESALADVESRARRKNLRPHVIAGGCHTPRGALAYRDVGVKVFDELAPDIVFVASGTGATHGGLAAAAVQSTSSPRVIGVSVARTASRGAESVTEAARWAGASNVAIEFDDEFVAGGYGVSDQRTRDAVALGWRSGLPLDATYTGKAFAALIEYANVGDLSGKRILFWHTGGLWNHLEDLPRGGELHE